jgi:hypothetical protein
MKISNLILIVFLACSMFFIMAFAFTVNKRYGSGEYESADERPEDMKRFTLPRCSAVFIRDLSHCVIIPSDSFAVVVSRADVGSIGYEVKQDTLYLTGRKPSTVKLYLPAMKGIYSEHSSLTLRGALRRSDTWASYHVDLVNSQLSTTQLPDKLPISQLYAELVIQGKDSSGLIIRTGTVVGHLKITDVPNVVIEHDAWISKIETVYRGKEEIMSRVAERRTEIHAR